VTAGAHIKIPRRGCAAAVALAAACGPAEGPTRSGARLAAAIAATVDAEHLERRPWRCASPDPPRTTRRAIQATRHWDLEGGALTGRGAAPALIGAVADAGGGAPPTLTSLRHLAQQLREADVVLALGGMGTTRVELEATLGVIAKEVRGVLIALPGDLESVGALSAAVEALVAQGRAVVDARQLTRVQLADTSIAFVPGAGAPARLVAGSEGCQYRPEDAAAVIAGLSVLTGVRVLALAEAPRVVHDGEVMGTWALTPSSRHPVDVLLYGQSANRPSRGRTGRKDGAAVALTPGASDSAPRLPPPRGRPSAGLLEVGRGTWSWKVVTAPEGPATAD
jgi:hypothetical protein